MCDGSSCFKSFYLNCISNFSVNLLVSTCSLANASIDFYNYEEIEDEVSGRSRRLLNGIKSVGSLTISDDSLAVSKAS